ncbi:flagellar biosynthesis protein FlhB [Marinagarivorans algicola]|uniref:flagellar biosynthesis protein FlhB n=1 Tax=Marinagarivorans algicola TaxID=1513270 RepID=UPI0006B95CAD|nr:flagellar biosynthesis protein FlhB [Marinagarivorans algicola]
MSANDSAQEKTEEPTSKRLEKAREDGTVPRSKELTTSALLILGTIALMVTGGHISATIMRVMVACFGASREVVFDAQKLLGLFASAIYESFYALIPFFATVLFACIAGPTALGGFLWSTKALAPKLNRMDPLAGLKRMFSMNALVELFKSIAKVLVVVFSAYFTLSYMRNDVLALVNQPIDEAIYNAAYLSAIATLIICASTLIVAAIDIPYQIYAHVKKLKMSMQDIKDEMKDSEGKPEVKGRIRQLQREMSQKRMMAEVPNADVVITNPTHYSVALKYDPTNMATPICVAKGVDFSAMKIREIARAHHVELVQAPALTRAIYHTTGLSEEIPSGLYVAVAQILAYIFQLREYRSGRGERPPRPNNINVPRDMRYD